ncbi:MAG: hypothetical protein F6K56_16685, partial [Moorea sp. SIO3G5]|nr:hypothetical protein [Moorena sp. SIO3G5]
MEHRRFYSGFYSNEVHIIFTLLALTSSDFTAPYSLLPAPYSLKICTSP